MGRRWGKTVLGGAISLATANAGGRVAWVVPTYRNGRPLWRWAENTVAPLKGAGLVTVNKTDRLIEFANGGFLGIYSADSADSIRGEAFHLTIVDEAAMVGEDVWTDVLMPTLADFDGDGVLISTPKGKNWFWREFASADGKTSVAFTAPSNANPMPTIRRAFDLARDRVSERTFRQEWLAEFVDDGGGVFRNVTEAATATPQPAAIDGHRYCIGVDWGRTNDATVFSVVDITTRSQCAQDRMTDTNYALQRGRLFAIAERFGMPLILAEQNSMGGPLIEQLQSDGLNVRPFQTTMQSKGKLIDALALAFERRDIHILSDATLVTELQAYESKQLMTGIRYGAPEGMHDDTVMALALAWQAADQPRASELVSFL